MQRIVSKLVASRTLYCTTNHIQLQVTVTCEKIRGNLTTCGNSYCTPKIFIDIFVNLRQQHHLQPPSDFFIVVLVEKFCGITYWITHDLSHLLTLQVPAASPLAIRPFSKRKMS